MSRVLEAKNATPRSSVDITVVSAIRTSRTSIRSIHSTRYLCITLDEDCEWTGQPCGHIRYSPKTEQEPGQSQQIAKVSLYEALHF